MTKRRARLPCLVLAIVVSGCGGYTPAVGEGAARRTDAWPGKYAFNVTVSLSGPAERKLRADGESVVVSVSYYSGAAKGAGPHDVNDVGLVDLGRAEVTLDGAGTVAFDGRAVQQDRLRLTKGEPEALISVFSGRRSSPDNLLSCDTYQEEVRRASGKTLRLSCGLLSERE